jgi:CheY-like chemotaxis protein
MAPFIDAQPICTSGLMERRPDFRLAAPEPQIDPGAENGICIWVRERDRLSLMDFATLSAPSPRSILVVDDNSVMREALVAARESAGYEVFQASNGNAAIADSRQHAVALLITDLVMPEGEGIETIRHYTQALPSIPIIAMSGMPEYLPVGAAVVLEKPIAYADLPHAVRNLIG